MRLDNFSVKKGYEFEQFKDAFARYLSKDVTSLQSSNDSDSDVAAEKTCSATANDNATSEDM